MARTLHLSLEPSDVLQALLRLRASSEAGRWPRNVSSRFKTAMAREFERLEPVVRAVGLCYAELEERNVAELDRRPQSRFSDVDGALHLAACNLEMRVDLDHLRVALERGDATVRETAAQLATSLRLVLWYTVHTDLFVAAQVLLAGVDVGPERTLRFVDGYLARAWNHNAPPEPPPLGDTSSGEYAPAAAPSERNGVELPFVESTAVFKPLVETSPGEGPLLTSLVDEHTMPAAFLRSERLADFHAPLADGGAMPEFTPRPSERLDHDQYTLPGRLSPVNGIDVLPADARFFLDESGIRWPCTARQLDDARVELRRRVAPGDHPRQGIEARAWVDRVERGFDELHQRLLR